MYYGGLQPVICRSRSIESPTGIRGTTSTSTITTMANQADNGRIRCRAMRRVFVIQRTEACFFCFFGRIRSSRYVKVKRRKMANS